MWSASMATGTLANGMATVSWCWPMVTITLGISNKANDTEVACTCGPMAAFTKARSSRINGKGRDNLTGPIEHDMWETFSNPNDKDKDCMNFQMEILIKVNGNKESTMDMGKY